MNRTTKQIKKDLNDYGLFYEQTQTNGTYTISFIPTNEMNTNLDIAITVLCSYLPRMRLFNMCRLVDENTDAEQIVFDFK